MIALLFTCLLAHLPLSCHQESTPNLVDVFTPQCLSLRYVGTQVRTNDEGRLVLGVGLQCLDRTGLTRPAALALASLRTERITGPSVDVPTLMIGEHIVVDWTLPNPEVHEGLYRLYLLLGDRDVLLGTLFLVPAERPALTLWSATARQGTLPLEDALQTFESFGVADSDVILLACRGSSRPEDRVRVDRNFEVASGEAHTLTLDVFDSYSSRMYPGHMEHRVYVDNEMRFQYDIGQDSFSGWYPVVIEFTPTSETVRVGIEVRPLKRLGSKGWGRASRTALRNVRILKKTTLR